MFEQFPYSNFHDLNLDWIVKIAKDFLDQYTHIQDIITEGENSLISLKEAGLEELESKATELQTALQAWYDQHSADISNELASAIQDINTKLTQTIEFFDQHAESKIQDLLGTIPADFSELVTTVNQLRTNVDGVLHPTRNLWKNPTYNNSGIVITENKDGSIHIQGTASTTAFIDKYYDAALPAGNYALSATKKGTATGNIGITTRNQQNTGTQIFYLLPLAEYGEEILTNFAPYRCEIILFEGKTYNCDLYVQLESGTAATDYVPSYSVIDYNAENRITNIENEMSNENILLEYMRNYKAVLEVTDRSNFTKWGASAGVVEHYKETVHYTLASAANGGFITPAFSTEEMIQLTTKLEFDLTQAQGGTRVWIWGTDKSGGTYANIIATPSAGHVEINIDFASLQVYSTLNTGKPIQFLFTNNGAEISDFSVTNLKLLSLVTNQNYIDSYSEEMVYEVLDNLSQRIPQETEELYLKSPDGNKWLITVNNNGIVQAQNILPMKSLFIGNSLLSGWGTFGMAALDNEHDYYYHVTHRISELNANARYNKTGSYYLEHGTNDTEFNEAFNAIKPQLTSDLNLICIQLGDNVNTTAKIQQFTKAGGSFDTMITWMKANCPNARIIWVGTWYLSIHDWLISACKAKNVQFIDILPLATRSNKASLGQVVHRTEDHAQTLTGSYTIQGQGLLLSIVLYNVTYTIAIPSYTNVEDNGNGTFTMTGPYTVIDSTGVQSHPNNTGMQLIADEILKGIGID